MKLHQFNELRGLHHSNRGLDIYLASSLSTELEVQLYSRVVHGLTVHNVRNPILICHGREFSQDQTNDFVIHKFSCETSISAQMNSNPIEMECEEMWELDDTPPPDLSYLTSQLAKLPLDELPCQPSCQSEASPVQGPVNPSAFVKQLPKEKIDGHFKLKTPSSKKLFVKNINFQSRKKDLCQLFEKFGAVQSCDIQYYKKTRKSKGHGFVTFYEDSSAAEALSASESRLTLHERVLQLEMARRRQFVPDKPSDEVDMNNGMQASSETESVVTPSNYLTDEDYDGSHIHSLNEYIMLHIFSYLPLRTQIQASRVCKRWQYFSRRSWQALQHLRLYGLSTKFAGLTDRQVKGLLARSSPSLTSIDLSGSSRFLTNTSLSYIGKYCPQVTRLDMSGMQVSNQGLEKLAKTCRQLQWVKLHRCMDVGEDGLWWLFHCCKDLTTINLEENKRVKGKCFQVLGRNVETLILSGCAKLGDGGLEKISRSCPLLCTMNLTGCITITDKAILSLTQGCKEIETFSMEGHIPYVTSSGLRHLSQLPRLKTLHLQKNVAVDDQFLKLISEGCPLIRCVHLACCHQGVTDLGLESLSRCSDLSELTISYLHQVHDTGLSALSVLPRLTKLEARGCGGFTNAGVIEVITQCTSLQHLDLSGCLQINNSVLPRHDTPRPHNTPLHLTFGGTSISVSDLPRGVPTWVDLVSHNLSASYLRADRDLSFYEPEEEDDIWYEYEDHSLGFGVSGASLDDYLTADDPLHAEDFDVS